MKFIDLLLIPIGVPIYILDFLYKCGFYTYKHYEQKENLRKAGYIVDPPLDYHLFPERYSTYRKHKWTPKIYTKYSKIYTYQEIMKGLQKQY